MATSLSPVLFKDTAPLKSFDVLVRVIALAPASKLLVNATLNAPPCVIAPPPVTAKFPLSVIPGITTGAFANISVMFRAFVGTPVTLAPALTFCSPISCTVPPFTVPIVTPPARSLACVSSNTSAEGAVSIVKLDVPATVNIPLSLMLPPAVTARLPPTVDAPRSIAFASVMVTSLSPVLFKDTAPLKSFDALVRVMALAPALKLLVPVTISVVPTPCVIAPADVALSDPAVVVP